MSCWPSATLLVVTECHQLTITGDMTITGKGNMRADRPAQEHPCLSPPAHSRSPTFCLHVHDMHVPCALALRTY